MQYGCHCMSCQEIAVCVKHDIGQLVRHFMAGNKWRGIILFTAVENMEQPCVPNLQDVS